MFPGKTLSNISVARIDMIFYSNFFFWSSKHKTGKSASQLSILKRMLPFRLELCVKTCINARMMKINP